MPRIIEVEYSIATDLFIYAFPILPALKVYCFNREVVQNVYLPLVLSSAYPVYFNPHVDFLYYKSLFDPLNLSTTPLLPVRPILPFINPRATVSIIRFLILDRMY